MTALAWWETFDEWAGVLDDMPDPLEGEAWRAEAACAGEPSTVFFTERGASSRSGRELCASCSVREPCLEYAVTNGIRFGIWGGSTERERRRLTLDEDGNVIKLKPGERKRPQPVEPDRIEEMRDQLVPVAPTPVVQRWRLTETLDPEEAARIATARAEHQEEVARIAAAREARRRQRDRAVQALRDDRAQDRVEATRARRAARPRPRAERPTADQERVRAQREQRQEQSRLRVTQRREVVMALRAEGHSEAAIAAAVGVSRSLVHLDLEELIASGQLERPTDPVIAIDRRRAKVKALQAEGLTQKAIAKALGLTRTIVYHDIKASR